MRGHDRKLDPLILAALVERMKRTRDTPGPSDVEAAGGVYELATLEIRSAMVCRVFDLDVAATLRGGESADEIRRALPTFGFRL